jgi:hypothetical protein
MSRNECPADSIRPADVNPNGFFPRSAPILFDFLPLVDSVATIVLGFDKGQFFGNDLNALTS